ncbi:hypothetical protein TSAR_006041 [Trichomalopsis sarcophagae]|uniref:Uncharacterized protein n=1 Tax=Trichomalopsis sarcophagae TaxID=543379 RepID=A0A232FF42_9HYME|nr:hypothetical protein TSAR_006041 [Trichomalopsis sarcophagae]
MTDSNVPNVKLKVTKRLQSAWGDLIVSKVREKHRIRCPFKQRSEDAKRVKFIINTSDTRGINHVKSARPLAKEQIDDLALHEDTITAILVICQSQSIDEGTWPNVMHRFYEFEPNKVSTPTASECYYQIMRREYGFNCPVGFNRFILLHIPLIDKATKLKIGA